MKSILSVSLSAAFAAALITGSVFAQTVPVYEFVPGFIKPPAGKDTIGNGHGEIQVDSKGNIYVSVEGQTEGGLQVYSSKGEYVKNLKLPGSLHGFSIRKTAEGEFIYGAVLAQEKVIKATLEGEIVLEIPKSAFPADKADAVSLTKKDGTRVSGVSPVDDGKNWKISDGKGGHITVAKDEVGKEVEVTLKDGSKVKASDIKREADSITVVAGGKERKIALSDVANGKDGKPAISEKSSLARTSLRLTNADCAPNGDIVVVDGYGANWIFVFDKTGKIKSTFGGNVEPYKLSNTHKVHVDTRFTPAKLFLCDRGNNRIAHTELDGSGFKVIATDMRRPSSASFHGDHVAIAEIAGRVSVWDKDGKMVAELGANNTPGQTNTPGVEPKDWKDNVVTSPHGITFDAQGNILETEWNRFGRVLRWNRK
jgi:hypothetical protein